MPEDAEWISKSEAARMLGVGRKAVEILLDERRLTLRSVPGSQPRVLRSEVEKLAAACTILAGGGQS